jgi:mannose-6-phosphate isomerase-like protein (cupin superfamily)
MNYDKLIADWQKYLSKVTEWEDLIEGVKPKATNCGPIYELKNPIERPHESFAIADMREQKVAEPHYHTGGESEIYFIISGIGVVVVAGQEHAVHAGSVVVTEPEQAHFTIPGQDLVMAVVNTPPFEAANVVDLHESLAKVGFDAEQYERLTAQKIAP